MITLTTLSFFVLFIILILIIAWVYLQKHFLVHPSKIEARNHLCLLVKHFRTSGIYEIFLYITSSCSCYHIYDHINNHIFIFLLFFIHRVFAATWNVGGQCPSGNLNLSDFLQVRNEPDMYVLGYALSLSLSHTSDFDPWISSQIY